MLEQLFPVTWLERKAWFSFILGICYATLGIGSALVLFPGEPGLASVAFISLLSLPSLNRILTIEEEQDAAEKKFQVSNIFRNHMDLLGVYVFLFIGVFLVFSVFAVFLPNIASNNLFSEQIYAIGLSGRAYSPSTFGAIFSNNMVIFLFSLIASFIYGSGAIFILIWNASVWGVVFGVTARNSASVNYNPLAYFSLITLAVIPHMITEASAYIMAALSGGIVSKAVLFEKIFSERFTKVVQGALVIFFFAVLLLIVSAYIESHITRLIFNLLKL